MKRASLNISIHTHGGMKLKINHEKDSYCCVQFQQKTDNQHAIPFFSIYIEEHELPAWQTLADTLAALDKDATP